MSLKKKILATAVVGTVLASNIVPAFAMTSEVPVYGNVGIWKPGDTNPGDGTGGGAGTPDKPITGPTTTDISVTVPIAMVFNIVTNTTDGNPEMATTTYDIENNGSTGLNVSAQYNVTDNGGITLVDRGTVNPVKGDAKLELAVGLQDGTGNDIIASLKNGATGTFDLDAQGGTKPTETLTFKSDKNDLSDVKAEQNKDNKQIKSNIIFTFTKK